MRVASRSSLDDFRRAPWANPIRLYSLYDMIKFAIEDFVKIITFLELSSTGDFSSDRAVRSFTNFHDLRDQCLSLNLRVTAAHTSEIIEEWRKTLPAPGKGKPKKSATDFVKPHAPQIADTLRRELSTRVFLAVTRESAIELFENPRPF